ncbi:MAG TPA: CheR family methyltransferase [Bacteroidota bacterium]|nr:CheR family methyltransferase [Bacteroidota bacterium]
MLTLSEKEFKRLSEFATSQIGISFPEIKMTMLQARLQKRLRILGMNDFKEYIDYLFSAAGEENESGEFINAVTTNKTDFFREPHHFQFLTGQALPTLEHEGLLTHRRLHAWSAASSYGHEAYTLGMVLSEYAQAQPGFTWSVLATDISTRVLRHGVEGVYRTEDIDAIPMNLKKKYLLRSRDPMKNVVRIVPSIRERVEFRRLNLTQQEFNIDGTFEVIFCRNVIIYFEKQTQVEILTHLFQYLQPGGYLFLGHSESLNGVSLHVESVAPTIYRKY